MYPDHGIKYKENNSLHTLMSHFYVMDIKLLVLPATDFCSVRF